MPTKKKTLAKLNSFLNANSPKLAYFLHHIWKNQQQAVTYKELREAIKNGEFDMSYLQQWQQDYSVFINTYYVAVAQKAIDTATQELRAQYPVLEDAMPSLMDNFIQTQGGRLIREVTTSQYTAINTLVRQAALSDTMTGDQLARAIRPCIGLTQRQAQSVFHLHNDLIDQGIDAATAQKRTEHYAEMVHRRRSMTIAGTELAFAYNEGQQALIEQAIKDGTIAPGATKVWYTAADERVCESCGKLDMQEVPWDATFSNGKVTAPAHPNCRCAVAYTKLKAPVVQPKPQPAVQTATSSLPQMQADLEQGQQPQPRLRLPMQSTLPLEEKPLDSKEEQRRREAVERIRHSDIWKDIDTNLRDKIVDSLQGDVELIEMAERCMKNCNVTWHLDIKDLSRHKPGTGHITIYGGGKSEDKLIQTVWHEYGHFLDDAKMSGSGVCASANAYKLGYGDAAESDLNSFLNKTGLSERYYAKYDGNSRFVDIFTREGNRVNAYTSDSIMLGEALRTHLRDLTGLTYANDYVYNIGYPRKPNPDDYFTARPIMGGTSCLAEEKYDGAVADYVEATTAYAEAEEAFKATHNMNEILEEQKRLKRGATELWKKIAYVSDTFDASAGAVFGAYAFSGGHKPEYYRDTPKHVQGEGVANVFMTAARGDPDVVRIFHELCPSTYDLFIRSWKSK